MKMSYFMNLSFAEKNIQCRNGEFKSTSITTDYDQLD